jgi:WD40 repeat protein
MTCRTPGRLLVLLAAWGLAAPGGRAEEPPCRAVLEGHTGSVWCVAFSPDGKQLAVAEGTSKVRLWDPATGRLASTIACPGSAIRSLAFADGGKTLAFDVGGFEVGLLDPATRQVRAVLTAHPGHNVFWLGGRAPPHRPYTVAVSPVGKVVVRAAWVEGVQVWEAASGKPGARLHDNENVTAVACSPAQPLLATLTSPFDDARKHYAGVVTLWDTTTGKQAGKMVEPSGAFGGLAFSPDGRMLATGRSEAVIVWEVASRGKRVTLGAGEVTGSVQAVAFSPEGRLVAAGDTHGRVRVWHALTGEKLAELEGHHFSVRTVAFSPDGKTLASGSTDGRVCLWDLTKLAGRKPVEQEGQP